jgi:ubiquinone/menaquinone biosynthesis C-methylase UbiE
MQKFKNLIIGTGIAALGIAAVSHAGLQSVPSGKIRVEAWEVRINERQPIPKVLEVMGVKPGLSIGEVGAGTGRVTVWLADAVGPAGKIYANDIDADALKSLQERCRIEKLNNVQTILGTIDNPKFPAGVLDIAFMTNTYHHLDKPIELVRNILPALKPDGRLVIVERDKDRCPASQRDEATSPADFARQMAQAGFEVVSTDTSMRVDNIYIARIKR